MPFVTHCSTEVRQRGNVFGAVVTTTVAVGADVGFAHFGILEGGVAGERLGRGDGADGAGCYVTVTGAAGDDLFGLVCGYAPRPCYLGGRVGHEAGGGVAAYATAGLGLEISRVLECHGCDVGMTRCCPLLS